MSVNGAGTACNLEPVNLGVYVATHKPYRFPTDPAYIPVQVGRANSAPIPGVIGDDTGPNISRLNETYSELTGLYWAWKNSPYDCIGLVHYRRYFCGRGQRPAYGVEMRGWLESSDIVLPRKRHYVIETVGSQYRHAHSGQDLDALRSAVLAVDGGSMRAFDKVMRSRSLHLYNMFIARRSVATELCAWMFAVLELARQNISMSSSGSESPRTMGFLGERLLNVWMVENRTLRVSVQRVRNLEGERRVAKAISLVARKSGLA